MKPFHQVLRIYGHHTLALHVMLPFAVCLTVAAHVLRAISYPRTAWCVFLSAIVSGSITSGFILGQGLKEGEETDLVPGYRTYQMTAAFAVPIILVAWGFGWTVFSGGPALASLSSFLSVAVLSLWYGLYCLNGLLFRDTGWFVRWISSNGMVLVVFWIFYNSGRILLEFSFMHGSRLYYPLASIWWVIILCVLLLTSWFGSLFLNTFSALAGGTVLLVALHDVFQISEIADVLPWSDRILIRFESLGGPWPLVLIAFSLAAALVIIFRYHRYRYLFEWDVYTYSIDYYWSDYSFIHYDGPKFPYMFTRQSWHRDKIVCLWNRDKTYRGAVDKAEQIITGMRLNRKAARPAPPLARLLQFGLFSPIFTVPSNWFYWACFCIAGTAIALVFSLTRDDEAAANFMVPGVFFLCSAVLANDFQGHRNRLPLLYLNSGLPSRAMFLKHSLAAYFRLVSAMSLSILTAALLMHPIIMWICGFGFSAKNNSPELIAAVARFHWSWEGLAQMIVMGIALAVGQIAVSLYTGSRKAYAAGPGWLAINALLLFPVTVIAYRFHSWPLSLAFVLIAGALLRHGRRRWLNTELDYA